MLEMSVDAAREYLRGEVQSLMERGSPAKAYVLRGEPAKTIAKSARESRVDLIAMATHGRTGLRTVIFGSVAGRVLYSGVRPVLLVRPGKLDDEPKVLWPTEATHGEAATG